MNAKDFDCLKSWIKRPTSATMPVTEGNHQATVEVSTSEEVKLQFFYPDMSGLSVRLKQDGTWDFVVGQ